MQKKILLCAFGITWEGRQEMIDFHPATSESAAAWESFLNGLYHRGLVGSCGELIVTDGGSGLHGALEVIYPKIPYQRCKKLTYRNPRRNLDLLLPAADNVTYQAEIGRINETF